MPSLLHVPRDYYDCDDFTGRCYRSNWDSYGRWVVVAVLIGAGFILFFIFACITARRRRRAGYTPYRGTGWLGGPFPPNHRPQQYYGGNQPPPPAAAPPYSPPNQGYYGNTGSNQGYFGGQQTGVELQPPQNTHQPQRGGDAVYEPPPGPPPKR